MMGESSQAWVTNQAVEMDGWDEVWQTAGAAAMASGWVEEVAWVMHQAATGSRQAVRAVRQWVARVWEWECCSVSCQGVQG